VAFQSEQVVVQVVATNYLNEWKANQKPTQLSEAMVLTGNEYADTYLTEINGLATSARKNYPALMPRLIM